MRKVPWIKSAVFFVLIAFTMGKASALPADGKNENTPGSDPASWSQPASLNPGSGTGGSGSSNTKEFSTQFGQVTMVRMTSDPNNPEETVLVIDGKLEGQPGYQQRIMISRIASATPLQKMALDICEKGALLSMHYAGRYILSIGGTSFDNQGLGVRVSLTTDQLGCSLQAK